MPRSSGVVQAEFCRRMYPRLFAMLRLYTGDAELAADLTQDSLARALSHWKRVETMQEPEGWVYRVAVNVARADFRRRMLRERLQRLPPSAPVIESPDPDTAMVVRSAVLALSERQRMAILLRYYLDLSVEDAAKLMSCRPGTVKALSHQAIEVLRSTLALEISA